MHSPDEPQHGDTAFADLARRFAERLATVRPCVDARYVRPDWVRRNAELERDLLPVPPPDFLRHPSIAFQMFVNERLLPHELPYVRSRLADERPLAEPPVGDPPTVPLPGSDLRTSSNTVHQLFHLLRYQEATGRRVDDAATIVEWGGGFGALIRVITALHRGEPTCVVFDTPTFSAVQWLYLSAVLGEERVVLHDTAPVRPVPGRVNLVPIGLVGATDVDADLFISNWALNESLPRAREDVVDRRWFGAGSLLLAMHAGDPFAQVVLATGATAVPLGDFMPGQHYLVA
ncbi:class I SAM-dependent methyltransferase [Saccharothrix hoggarensis]|uniref:Sugar O-methyltransferase n=1 Tax=Saccharothrix hoggarensis TaxID=913853 RepID=A0ABW3QYZ1_9PSEU